MDEVEKWNPMKEDFQSPSFNSYTRGPGTLLPSRGERREPGRGSGSSDEGGRVHPRQDDNVALFVDRIPMALTKVGSTQ